MRRVLTVVLLILGAVGVVVCGGGILGATVGGRAVNREVTEVHGAVDDLLSGVQGGIRRIEPEIAGIRHRLRSTLTEAVATQLEAELRRVNAFLTTLADTANAVAGLVDAPGTDRPLIDELRRLAKEIGEADLGNLRIRAETASAERAGPVLQRVQGLLESLHRSLSTLRLEVTTIRNRVVDWTRLIVIALAGICLWMALGQACLFTSQARRLRRVRPPDDSPR